MQADLKHIYWSCRNADWKNNIYCGKKNGGGGKDAKYTIIRLEDCGIIGISEKKVVCISSLPDIVYCFGFVCMSVTVGKKQINWRKQVCGLQHSRAFLRYTFLKEGQDMVQKIWKHFIFTFFLCSVSLSTGGWYPACTSGSGGGSLNSCRLAFLTALNLCSVAKNKVGATVFCSMAGECLLNGWDDGNSSCFVVAFFVNTQLT